jgi:hypothetical protein
LSSFDLTVAQQWWVESLKRMTKIFKVDTSC